MLKPSWATPRRPRKLSAPHLRSTRTTSTVGGALAELERAQGRTGYAVTLLEEGLDRMRAAGRSHPGRGQLHFRLGLAYTDLARRDETAKELNLALKLIRGQHTRTAVEEALQAATDAPRGAR